MKANPDFGMTTIPVSPKSVNLERRSWKISSKGLNRENATKQYMDFLESVAINFGLVYPSGPTAL